MKYFNKNFISNDITIYDCFDYNQKIKFGPNPIFCNYCTINRECAIQTLLTAGPEILILILNRDQGIEYNSKFLFYENLNLNKYIQYYSLGFKYKLIGVISYNYIINAEGNFVSYCRDPITGNWIKYDNDNIIDINNF